MTQSVTAGFLPLIRRTPSIRTIEQTDWRGINSETLQPFPPDVLHLVLCPIYI